jgi:glycosyltransferase involved in cell wall biosynthesis
MDVGIIASHMEGYGRVTVELMLSEVPVIGYASGGTKEIIDDGVTGFLYNTLEELVDYMLFFARNESKIEEMGKAGYIRAKNQFTAEKNADLIYSVYEKMLNNGGGIG